MSQPTGTFKQRVTKFWDWYPQVADRFYQTIEAGDCGDLAGEVSEFMDQNLPHLAWVFGPGEEGGHSFTVSGDGILPKQLLALYWQSRAVELPHWTFYASRQPADSENLKNLAIRIGETESVDVENFLVQTAVDEEAKKIDVVCWHPALSLVPQEHHMQILFLLMDEALGEFGTDMWLGTVDVEPITAGPQTRSLAELPEFIRQLNDYYQWNKHSPLDTYSLYEVGEQSEGRRGDTVVGSTSIPRVIFDFLENQGELSEDPLEGTGAEFAYIAIDNTVFPEGNQSEARGNIEDAVNQALELEQSGRTLGGAFGMEQSYIDMVFFDGENSRQIVERKLAELNLSEVSDVESFC